MNKLLFITFIAVCSMTNVNAGTATYTYDNLGRVTKVTYSNGKTVTYTYDAVGNRVTVVNAG